jgi:hypothetical protein
MIKWGTRKQYDIEERSTYYSSKWWFSRNPFINERELNETKTGKLYYYEQLYDNMGQAPKLKWSSSAKLRRPRVCRMAPIILLM